MKATIREHKSNSNKITNKRCKIETASCILWVIDILCIVILIVIELPWRDARLKLPVAGS